MITIKRGDTGIGIKATLFNEKGNVNLTDTDVLFLMHNHVIKADLEDAENGKVKVFFNSINTENTGIYYAEFEVRFPDGRIETFPNDSYLKIRIIDDLGGIG